MLTHKPDWVAVMTWPGAENLVANRFEEGGIEHYLPMIQARDLRFKHDVNPDKPMFPCYLFARINDKQIYQTRTTRGVIQIVSSQHSIIVVPQRDIDNVKAFEASKREWYLHETHKLVKGAWVAVTEGEFAGMQGRLVSNCSDGNFCVSLSVMNISFVVELSRSELVPAAEPADANGKGIWNK
ncbi:MAG: transcription termination/antitermination NusG family protein [Bacteroidales bacterium]|nr:transcription termination/antitermination NusG family protein [Bacteroidales bacterium]